MADGRILHKKASHGDRVRGLSHLEYRVWTQYILSADDYGVMRASAAVIQADNRNLDDEPTSRIKRAMDAILNAGLVETFTLQGQVYWWQVDWQDFQQIKYPRDSVHPTPPEADLERATEPTRSLFLTRVPGHSSTGQQEARLRDAIARSVRHALTVDVASVETECRIGNSYCDVVVRLVDGRYVAVEVKRHPVTQAALNQVRRYRDALATSTHAEVVALLVCRQGRKEGQFDHHDVTLAEFDNSYVAVIETCQIGRLLFRKQWVLFDKSNALAGAGGRETLTLTPTPTLSPTPSEEEIAEEIAPLARVTIVSPHRPGRQKPLVSSHMGCFFAPNACARGVCVPSWLGTEWLQQFDDPQDGQAEIAAFIAAILSRLPAGPVGDPPKDFWRAAWRAHYGSVVRAGSRTGDSVAAAQAYLAGELAKERGPV